LALLLSLGDHVMTMTHLKLYPGPSKQ